MYSILLRDDSGRFGINNKPTAYRVTTKLFLKSCQLSLGMLYLVKSLLKISVQRFTIHSTFASSIQTFIVYIQILNMGLKVLYLALMLYLHKAYIIKFKKTSPIVRVASDKFTGKDGCDVHPGALVVYSQRAIISWVVFAAFLISWILIEYNTLKVLASRAHINRN